VKYSQSKATGSKLARTPRQTIAQNQIMAQQTTKEKMHIKEYKNGKPNRTIPKGHFSLHTSCIQCLQDPTM